MGERSRRERIQNWLRERSPVEVELRDFEELRQLLAPVTDSNLRRLLRDSGARLDPFVEGVNQDDFISLGRTLTALTQVYDRGSDAERRLARQIVITAKDHAKLAARNQRVDESRRSEKAEMAAWMLTWLDNPDAFPLWVAIRMRALRLSPIEIQPPEPE